MTDGATLSAAGKQLDLSLVQATEGNNGYNISALLKETGNVTLDGGFTNTASCTSAITYIDGDHGILRYRGYPIEQLAEHSNFIETSFLLIYGDLPSPAELADFESRIRDHTMLHEDLKAVLPGLPARRAPDAGAVLRRVARCRPSTRTASTPSTRSRSRSRRSACWPSCRPSRPTPTRSRSASRSSTPTTTCRSSRTSCG